MFNIPVISAGGSQGLCRSPAAERSLEPPRRPSAQQRSPRPSATTAPQRPTGRPGAGAMGHGKQPWKLGKYVGINWLMEMVEPKAWLNLNSKVLQWLMDYRNNDWWWEDYIKSPASWFVLAVAKSVCLSSSKVPLQRQNVVYGQCSVPNLDACHGLWSSSYNLFIDYSFAEPSGFHLIIGQMVKIRPNVGALWWTPK